MRVLRGLIDRLLLVAAVLCAGAVPSFIAQYRQRLGGRLDQVLHDLTPFQQIANQSQGGSLDALVRYHLASADPTFHAEGEAIQAMMDSAAMLRMAVQALNTDLTHQLWFLSQHIDTGLARTTLQTYVPSVPFTGEGLVFAAIVGVLIWALFQALWLLLAAIMGGARRPRRPAAPPVPKAPPRPPRREPSL